MNAVAIGSPRAFVVRWCELDRWVVPSAALLSGSLPAGWKRYRVGEVVKPVSNPVRVQPQTEYKLAGVKWYGEGVFHRETVLGRDSSAHFLSPLVPGALIYNRLFAWKSSFAVVPHELGNCFVSNEFPQFIPDSSKVLPEYLYLWCTTEQTIKAVNAASTGSAAVSRNRFREVYFLDFEISLPPLSVQRKIVAAWEAARKSGTVTEAKIKQLAREIEARFLADLGLQAPTAAVSSKVCIAQFAMLDRWAVDFNQQLATQLDPSTSKYPVAELRDVVADLENGWSPKCLDRPASKDEWGVLKMGAVSFGFFDERQNKAIPPELSPRLGLEVRCGDLLISRANITRLVGACALVRNTRPGLMLCDKIFRTVWRESSPVDPRYLDEVLKLPHLRRQIEGAVTGTSATMKNITKPALLSLRFPLPSLRLQREMMDRIEAKRTEIAKLKADAKSRAESAKADVEAMILGTKPVH